MHTAKLIDSLKLDGKSEDYYSWFKKYSFVAELQRSMRIMVTNGEYNQLIRVSITWSLYVKDKYELSST